jgi:hypothetical protein
MRRLRALLVLLLVVPCVLAGPSSVNAKVTCRFGDPVRERSLILPRPGTFYAVDALAPDVVRWRGRYLMYFSGNATRSPLGRWQTGLAVARSPLGPFRVRRGFRLPYLNGGTVAWRGRLWQLTARTDDWGQSVLLSSRDGLQWRRVMRLPRVIGPFRVLADPSLQVVRGRLRAWLVGREPGFRFEPGLGSRIVSLDLIGGRWARWRVHLYPGRFEWSSVDLGAPSAFRWQSRVGLLFTAMGATSRTRVTGLALRLRGHWRTCGPDPLIPAGAASWGPGVSIDAVALPAGRRLYVYYGAGHGLSVAADLGGGIGVRVYGLG